MGVRAFLVAFARLTVRLGTANAASGERTGKARTNSGDAVLIGFASAAILLLPAGFAPAAAHASGAIEVAAARRAVRQRGAASTGRQTDEAAVAFSPDDAKSLAGA
jgi:hypothetical protein